MPSELQRVAQAVVAALDEVPRVVDYLLRTAQKCRENARYVGHLSNNPAAKMAAMQLDEAARRCEEAAHYLAQAQPKARGWAEQTVSGGRTAAPRGGGGARRPDASGGSTPPAERRPDDNQAEPEGKKSGETAGAGNRSGPDDLPPPRVTEEEGRRLQGKLPIREDTLGRRDKTRGIWVDRDGVEQDLVSGETDLFEEVKQFLKDNNIGPERGELMTPTHVETKFAMVMRLRGLKHETIVVNQVPCKGKWGCEELIHRILPAGSTLTVFGPNGFIETYPKPPTRGTEPA